MTGLRCWTWRISFPPPTPWMQTRLLQRSAINTLETSTAHSMPVLLIQVWKERARILFRDLLSKSSSRIWVRSLLQDLNSSPTVFPVSKGKGIPRISHLMISGWTVPETTSRSPLPARRNRLSRRTMPQVESIPSVLSIMPTKRYSQTRE